MLICNFDGELFIRVNTGEISFISIGSYAFDYYSRDLYEVNLLKLAADLNLDIQALPDMECEDCPNYSECLEIWDDGEFDNTYCVFIDDKKTSKMFMKAVHDYVEKCPRCMDNCAEDEYNDCSVLNFCMFLRRK